jgi:hypothetical protein
MKKVLARQTKRKKNQKWKSGYQNPVSAIKTMIKFFLFICCCCQPLPCYPWWFIAWKKNPSNPQSKKKKSFELSSLCPNIHIPWYVPTCDRLSFKPYTYIFLTANLYRGLYFFLQTPDISRPKIPKSHLSPNFLTCFGSRFKKKKNPYFFLLFIHRRISTEQLLLTS